MPRPHPPDAAEFKVQRVELVRAGRSPESLAEEFEPSPQTLRNGVHPADLDKGRRADGLTTAERDELLRPRKENRALKLEPDILGQDAAWFARDALASTPCSDSMATKWASSVSPG